MMISKNDYNNINGGIFLIELKRRGLMYVMSSPSGAGKTTITRALLKNNDDVMMSISATTRPRRAGEVHGRKPRTR